MNQYKIVFSDVDGTLLNQENVVTPLTSTAIKSIQEQGIPFVISTGRAPSGVFPIQDDNHFSSMIISFSGGLILDEQRNPLFQRGMSKREVVDMISYMEAEKMPLAWCTYTLEDWIVKDRKDPRIAREEAALKAESVEKPLDEIPEDATMFKIMCICDPGTILDVEEKMKKKFPNYNIVKSSDVLLEIMEKSVTKALAVEELCKLKGIKLEEAIAFGDNYNDYEMLKVVGQPFLMDNAPDALKEEFEHITKDNNSDGIYYGLKGLGVL